ncbi:MAG: hypothetical protein ACOCUF_02900 [Patescibacteria group bacterium]
MQRTNANYSLKKKKSQHIRLNVAVIAKVKLQEEVPKRSKKMNDEEKNRFDESVF